MAEKKTTGVIEGTLAFAKIAQPDTKYQSKDTEYSIQIIIDEDAADAWEAEFKKQPARKIKAAEFEAKYKFPCPIKGAKNVYAVTLKKDAVVNGEEFNPQFRPKVLLDKEDERVDITESRLIANGSYGKVSYRITSNDFGTFARLNNILIAEDQFKEYVSTSTSNGEEFGDSKPVTKEAPKASATQARKPKAEPKEEPVVEKPVKGKAKQDNFADLEDSAPF